jgi:hypothetical protein
MSVVEKINQSLKKLPEKQQIKVLEFIENLETEAKPEIVFNGDDALQNFSLEMAMHGMEEDNSFYTQADLNEIFDEKTGASSSL